MPTAVQEGTTIHRTLTHDAYDETWTDELEGRPVHNGTPLEVHVRGRWVPVVYLRDSHTSREGPRAFLRYQKGKKTVPLAENMALRWPPPAPPVPELPHYLWWGDVPEGLLTKTALKSKGLKPGGPPVATIRYGRRNHYQETVLYDRAQAMPRAGATPAQLAALQKAQEVRKENEQRRRDEEAAEVEREEAEWEAWLAEQAEEGRIALREIVARGNWLSLDTETTGIDEGAEVVEVALVSPTGKVLFESLVRPVGPVREEARAVHGITDEELAAAPSKDVCTQDLHSAANCWFPKSRRANGTKVSQGRLRTCHVRLHDLRVALCLDRVGEGRIVAAGVALLEGVGGGESWLPRADHHDVRPGGDRRVGRASPFSRWEPLAVGGGITSPPPCSPSAGEAPAVAQ